MSKTIAVDVGGTQLRVAIYPEEGILPIDQARTPTRGVEGTPIERLMDLIASIWPADGDVKAIGIAAPGPVNPKLGMIYAAPNIAGWIDLPLSQILQDRFQVPVFLGNDANLACLGEWQYGAGQGHHNVLYLTISTGIGGGAICDDQLVLGESGLAVEVGHITVLPNGPLCGCGKKGHLEALASGTALANYVAEELDKGRVSSLAELASRPTAKEIGMAAGSGDRLAIEAYERAAYYLGIGIVNFLHLFNPSVVILGGGVTKSLFLVREIIDKTIVDSLMSPAYYQDLTITTAQLKDNAGLLGALVLARSSRVPCGDPH